MKNQKKTKKLTTSVIDENITNWKKINDCKIRFEFSNKAIEWVKALGNFSISPSPPKKFKMAMSIDSTHNLESAFASAIIIGTICQESSFGTNFNNTRDYKGAFQLAQIVVTEYNNNNPSNIITFPNDVDDIGDIEKASRVAAWYFAMNLQRLTKSSNYVNAVTDILEAQKFAIASYNGGPTLIKNAREITTEVVGGEREKWEKVKSNLESVGATTAKANEIRNYVDLVLAYSSKSATCWCDRC